MVCLRPVRPSQHNAQTILMQCKAMDGHAHDREESSNKPSCVADTNLTTKLPLRRKSHRAAFCVPIASHAVLAARLLSRQTTNKTHPSSSGTRRTSDSSSLRQTRAAARSSVLPFDTAASFQTRDKKHTRSQRVKCCVTNRETSPRTMKSNVSERGSRVKKLCRRYFAGDRR